MAQVDPRLATIAAGLAARLELEASLGTAQLSLRRLPALDVLPPRKAPNTSPSSTESADNATPTHTMESTEAQPLKTQTGENATFSSPKEAALAPTREEALACTRCRLCETRNHVVFGEGSLDADIVFVGEAPGADEDATGRPFVGRAGELLTAMIERGLKIPRADVYICNILKCRPPKNNDPLPDQVAQCAGYLRKQIEIIRPRVIVALGRPAANALTGESLPIKNMRGKWWDYLGFPLMPTYHPAYLLRVRQREGRGNVSDKRAWEDLQMVMRRLQG